MLNYFCVFCLRVTKYLKYTIFILNLAVFIPFDNHVHDTEHFLILSFGVSYCHVDVCV